MKKLLIVLVVLMAVLTGCKKSKVESNVVYIGSSADFSPFEFFDEKNTLVGFDVDIIKALDKEMPSYQLEFKPTAWDGLIPALQMGNIQAIISSMTITEERLKTVDFTDSYYESGVGIAVKVENTSINSANDLIGKKIAAQIGTTGAMKAAEIKGAKLTEFNFTPECFIELKNGSVDAVMNDLPVLQYYISQQNDGKVKVVGGVLDPEYLGIALKKGNKALLEEFNKAIAVIKANGEYDKIYDKWFGSN